MNIPPTTVFLRNDSPGRVYYSPTANVKASLMVTAHAPAFGSVLTDASSVSLSNTATTLTLDLQSSDSSGVDFMTNPNAITIIQRGIYRVDAMVMGKPNVGAAISLGVRNSGFSMSNMYQEETLSANESVTFSLSNFVELNAGEYLTLAMTSVPDSTFNLPSFGIGRDFRFSRLCKRIEPAVYGRRLYFYFVSIIKGLWPLLLLPAKSSPFDSMLITVKFGVGK